ncbi:MAG: DNA repair exonuclease [Clostridiaceae bacterium]|nr:DNA repair exonuclease [Clostridiaceae bacterium]
MKFVHIADMHFDMPFRLLSDRADLGEIRRLDQRKAFRKMIDYIKENNIPYLFIAGDLYDQEYIKESTIKFINELFCEIPNTKIYITPGNHDPYLRNSYYAQYNWNSNVKIFKSNIERIENEDFVLYGYGFEDFYCRNSKIEEIQINDKEKLNILLAHVNLDGSDNLERDYNNISSKKLKEIGFDYSALGHIHKNNIEGNNSIIYPGSTISLGFDELGTHGMIVGNLEKNNLKIELIQLDEKQLKEIELDTSEIYSIEELLEKISQIKLEKNNLYKIILVGNRNFEINIYKLIKMIEIKEIIKIKDNTKIGYDLDKLEQETTLRGLYIKEIKDKIEQEPQNKETLQKALEIGLDVLS